MADKHPRPAGRTEPLNSWAILDTTAARFTKRARLVFFVVTLLVGAMVLRLTWVQLIAGPALAQQAANQRTAVITDPAHRGAITDRNGRTLAYTMEARSLSVHPARLKDFMAERHRLYPDTVPDADERLNQIVDQLPGMITTPGSRISKEDLRRALTSNSPYEVLVRNVDPDVAERVAEKFPEITAERQDMRLYPNGAVASNVVGKINADNQGQFGLELSQDAHLQGVNGSRTVDIAGEGYAIPGSARDEHPAVDGDAYQLTLDLDAQAFVQQQVQQAREKSGAKAASAVVLDAKTGDIVAMASSDTVNPNGDIAKQLNDKKVFGDRNTAETFEPGSIAKIMTAAAAIEEGKTQPGEVLQVPGSIDMSGVTVRDAWQHGTIPLTTTGVFGKSSNVGTLMLAQRVGPDKMYDYFKRFGIGEPLNVGMPYETAGYLPALPQWSGGKFANLPIGQGMSVSTLHMASVYQGIANDGVRIQPRLIKEIKAADGSPISQPEREQTRVVSPRTAETVLSMFRAAAQKDPTGVNQGTAPQAAIPGYQVSGKTGTAQQFDEKTGAYSNSAYWITFCGIAPADNPRFVVSLMLDNPQRGPDGGGGGTAAPLFNDVASWLLDHYNVPPSGDAGPMLMLQER